MDIRIELITVLLDGELLVVVDRDKDFLCAHGLLLGVVELLHVRMLEGLLRSQPLIRIELEQTL